VSDALGYGKAPPTPMMVFEIMEPAAPKRGALFFLKGENDFFFFAFVCSKIKHSIYIEYDVIRSITGSNIQARKNKTSFHFC
jgi:hypothetical protein